jgi:putative hydrolase of the HAD superfamily
MVKISRLTDAIFDVGGVLYTLDYDRMFRNFFNVCGKPIEKIKKILNKEDLFINFEKGRISSIEYYKAIIPDFECSLSFGEFKRIFNSFLIKRNQMFNLLYTLKSHINIHILSNTNEINAEVLNDDLVSIPSSIVYSFQTGYKKPEHEIFNIALKKAGAEPKKTIFIDDTEENVNAAKELGLNYYLFKSKKELLKTMQNFGITLQ